MKMLLQSLTSTCIIRSYMLVTFLVVYNEDSWGTNNLCHICLSCEFAFGNPDNISSKLNIPNHVWIKINKNKVYILSWCVTKKKCASMYFNNKKDLILWRTTTIARVWKCKASLVCILLFWHNSSTKSCSNSDKFTSLQTINPCLHFYLKSEVTN